MAKTARRQSESGMYHVVTRGVGRQLTFEDDVDRRGFFHLVERIALEERIEVFAWCLMSNHVHLVVRSELKDLSRFMLRVISVYVRDYNERHRRVGPLFQHPFWSDPILTDERMLATVRYVHQNPLKPGLAPTCGAYRWSSYREYLGSPTVSNVDFMLSLLGGVEQFRRFHEEFDDPHDFLDVDNVRIRRTYDEAIALAHALIGADSISNVGSLPKLERDGCLRLLKDNGLTHQQIVLMTGLGRNIVARA